MFRARLNLGLLLFVVCFSGFVATLSHEIDWLALVLRAFRTVSIRPQKSAT